MTTLAALTRWVKWIRFCPETFEYMAVHAADSSDIFLFSSVSCECELNILGRGNTPKSSYVPQPLVSFSKLPVSETRRVQTPSDSSRKRSRRSLSKTIMFIVCVSALLWTKSGRIFIPRGCGIFRVTGTRMLMIRRMSHHIIRTGFWSWVRSYHGACRVVSTMVSSLGRAWSQ